MAPYYFMNRVLQVMIFPWFLLLSPLFNVLFRRNIPIQCRLAPCIRFLGPASATFLVMRLFEGSCIITRLIVYVRIAMLNVYGVKVVLYFMLLI